MPIAVGGYVEYPAVTIVAPVAGAYLDTTSTPPTLEWTYVSPASNTQTAWSVRRKVSGASTYLYWNSATNTWGSAWVWNSGSIDGYTFPSGSWPDGYTYNFSIAVQDASGFSPFPADQTLVSQAAPIVSLLWPSGSAAYASSATPTVKWVPVLPSGAVQETYRVVILTAAQRASTTSYDPTTSSLGVTWDSGVVSSPNTSVVVGTPLPNGASYTAYVEITESGSESSGWILHTFTTAYTAPATPTLTLTPSTTTPGTTTQPYVSIVLTDNQTSLVAGATTTYTIESSDDGGTTWWPVRNASGLTMTTAGVAQPTIVDYEGSPGFTTMYQAQVQVVDTSGNVRVSNVVSASAVHPSPLNFWLKDPLVPSSNMNISLQDRQFSTSTTDRKSVIWCTGRPDPVVLSDVPALPQLSMTLVFLTDASYQAFENLRTSQHTLLFQAPNPLGQWYVQFGAEKSDATDMNSVRSGSSVVRTVPIMLQAVAAP